MKKRIKRGVFISILLFIVFFTFYSLFDCRFYRNKKCRDCFQNITWATVNRFQESIQDSVIDWNPLMKMDSTIQIISINNKKDSLEFFIIHKGSKEYSIKYYVNNEMYDYISFIGSKWYYE